MANEYVNKVVYGGTTLIDLTGDNITASDVLSGKKAHDRSGAPITGTCTYNADTSDATATAGEILSGKTAYVNGNKIAGTMSNNGAVSGTITTKAQVYTVPAGYHDGSGTVQIAATEQAKLIATNIRENVTILGVTGTMSGSEGVNPQSKSVSYTPTVAVQTATILPETGFNYLSEVSITINAVPYSETDNAAGGKTVTILQ